MGYVRLLEFIARISVLFLQAVLTSIFVFDVKLVLIQIVIVYLSLVLIR